MIHGADLGEVLRDFLLTTDQKKLNICMMCAPCCSHTGAVCAHRTRIIKTILQQSFQQPGRTLHSSARKSHMHLSEHVIWMWFVFQLIYLSPFFKSLSRVCAQALHLSKLNRAGFTLQSRSTESNSLLK